MSGDNEDNNNDELRSEIKKITADPLESLETLRNTFSNFEESVNDQKYQFMALIVAHYYEVADSLTIKSDFVKLMKIKWSASKISDKQLLLLVFRYVLKAPRKGALYERARIYARALGSAASKRTDPAEIPKLIKEAHGIEELYANQQIRFALEAESSRHGSNNQSEVNDGAATDDEGEADENDEGNGNDEDDLNDEQVGVNGDKPKPAPESGSQGAKIPFDKKKDLIVTSTQEMFAYICESKARSGQFFVEFDYPNGEPFVITLTDFVVE